MGIMSNDTDIVDTDIVDTDIVDTDISINRPPPTPIEIDRTWLDENSYANHEGGYSYSNFNGSTTTRSNLYNNYIFTEDVTLNYNFFFKINGSNYTIDGQNYTVTITASPIRTEITFAFNTAHDKSPTIGGTVTQGSNFGRVVSFTTTQLVVLSDSEGFSATGDLTVEGVTTYHYSGEVTEYIEMTYTGKTTTSIVTNKFRGLFQNGTYGHEYWIRPYGDPTGPEGTTSMQ